MSGCLGIHLSYIVPPTCPTPSPSTSLPPAFTSLTSLFWPLFPCSMAASNDNLGMHRIMWFHNQGGSPPTFIARTVVLAIPQATTLYLEDMNGDGKASAVQPAVLSEVHVAGVGCGGWGGGGGSVFGVGQ